MKECCIHLAFGSNLGDRHQNIHKAIMLLRQKINFDSFSFLYETDPVGLVDQPKFLNAAGRGCTTLSQEELLDFCEEVMRQMGRERTIVMGPRIIDIDIIFYENLVVNTEKLVLPHPRAHERVFVLQPLCDIDPNLKHPVLRKSIRKLLAQYKEQVARVTPIGNQLLYHHQKTYVMGIMNATPDSFSCDGLYAKNNHEIVTRLQQVKNADLIDIGGMSSRPGHSILSEEEEINRIKNVISLVKNSTSIPISVDTFRASVASFAIEHGAQMVNSVWGGDYDPKILEIVSRYAVPIVLMQNRMRTSYFSSKKTVNQLISQALRAGVYPWNIIVDPGIGFVQNQKENKELIRLIPRLKKLGYLVLVGTSRKRFLRSIVGKEDNDELISANVACHVYLASLGAHVVRVHDVEAVVDGMRIFDTLRT